MFVLHAEAPARTAREALQHMWREWNAARTDGFRASEVVRAQRILESRWLRRLESMDGQATYLAAWEADGGLAAAERYYARTLSLPLFPSMTPAEQDRVVECLSKVLK